MRNRQFKNSHVPICVQKLGYIVFYLFFGISQRHIFFKILKVSLPGPPGLI